MPERSAVPESCLIALKLEVGGLSVRAIGLYILPTVIGCREANVVLFCLIRVAGNANAIKIWTYQIGTLSMSS